MGEGTTRRGTATPVHRPQRPAGSTHSSTRGLRPPEQLDSADQNCRGQFIKPRVETITKVSTGGNGVTVLYHGHTVSCSQGDTPPTPGLTPSPPGSQPHHHHPSQTRCSIPSVLSALPSPTSKPTPETTAPEGTRGSAGRGCQALCNPPPHIPTLPQTQAPHIHSGLLGTRVLTSPLPWLPGPRF